MIGSGPFSLEGYTPDVAYVYKKNPDWFEKGKVSIDGAKRVIVTDPNAHFVSFRPFDARIFEVDLHCSQVWFDLEPTCSCGKEN